MGLYDDVYAAFEAARVRYVVVGGTAVVLSGHVRATIDLGRRRRPDTRRGAPGGADAPCDLADPDVRAGWIRDKHMQVLSFFDPRHLAREVDVFVAYPYDFELLLAAAIPTPVGGRLVPVAAKEHLIAMKLAAGRPRDLDDVAALQRLIDDERHL